MSRPSVKISKLNETWLKVHCQETWQELDIQDRFSFMIPNARHDPRVKKGHWDGVKRLFNRRDKKMYLGLLLQLLSLCEEKGWDVDLDPRLLPSDETIDKSDILYLCNELIKPHSNGNPIVPHDYQLDAVEYMMNMDRTICLSATSSGKSLMIYLAARMYQLMDEFDNKTIFIIVPSISLVEQMYSDFQDYSTFDGMQWHVNAHVQKVSGKYEKYINKQIVITTWQSMKNLPYDVYENIGAVFCDEAHGVKADVLTSILESLTQCGIRHGLTGTLDDVECNELVIQGLLGPKKVIVTAKEIMDSGAAAQIKVTMVVLNHNQATINAYRQHIYKYPFDQKYLGEIEYLYANEERSNLILDLIESLEGNTLVLFDRVEKYGEPLYQKFLERRPDTTFLITGDVEGTERETIRKNVEDQDACTIFASFGTMSTGISIKRLHNMVVISSSKSKIRVLQSIGRMMRKHFSKDVGNVFDIVDDLTAGQDKPNYSMQHAAKKLEFYTKEQFDVGFIKLDL